MKTHQVLEELISAKTMPVWNEKDRIIKQKEAARPPQILLAGNRLINLLMCKHATFHKKGKMTQRAEPRGQNPEPWRIIPKTKNLIKEFPTFT